MRKIITAWALVCCLFAAWRFVTINAPRLKARIAAAALALMLAAPAARAQTSSTGSDQFGLAVSTNTQLTVPSYGRCALITVEGASVRRTSDGTGATTTNGTLIPAGTQWNDCGPLAAYKFTAVSGSPTLDVEYFK